MPFALAHLWESAMNESLTIDEFCAAEKISRPFFYKLEGQGRAPRTYHIGRVRRISHESRAEWQAARQAETPDQETLAMRTAAGRKAVGSRKDRQPVEAA